MRSTVTLAYRRAWEDRIGPAVSLSACSCTAPAMRPSAVPPIAIAIVKRKIVPPALEAQPQVSQQRQNFFCYPAHEDRKIVSWTAGQLGLLYVPRTLYRQPKRELGMIRLCLRERSEIDAVVLG